MSSLFDNAPIDIIAYAKVAPERGIDWARHGLTYSVPASLRGLEVGQRVIVPLGRGDKPVEGYVVSISERCDLPPSKLEKIKPIVSRDTTSASLTPDLMELARWMASYYCCPLGMVFSTMLPAAVKHGTGTVQKTMVGLAEGRGKREEGGGTEQGTLDSRQETGDRGRAEAADSDRLARCPKGPARTAVDSQHSLSPAVIEPAQPPAPTDALTTASETKQKKGKKEPKEKNLTKLQRAVLDAAVKQKAAGVDWTEVRELADLACAKSISAVQQLIAKGLLITQTQSAIRAAPQLFGGADGQNTSPDTSGLILTPDQDRAIEHLAERVGKGFSVTLLHGVTGSGKTEVYLRAIEKVMAISDLGCNEISDLGFRISDLGSPDPQSAIPPQSEIRNPKFEIPPPPAAIVLVPEIALTPQTSARFHRRFQNVAVLHSGLTAAQRHEQWRRIRHGEVSIVVGARSAVFAPLPRVGIIIVDEEHENSYKQDQLPRYHARDVAIKRAQLLGIPVLLGSATPSLESYWNAGGGERGQETGDRRQETGDRRQETGDSVGDACDRVARCPKGPARETDNAAAAHSPSHPLTQSPTHPAPRARYQLLRLPTRVPGLTLPRVEIIDLTEERRKRYEITGKAGVHLLSLRLEAAIRRTWEAKAQTLLLLNRRGFANYIACPDHKCGWLMKCEFCDTTMVYHKQGDLPTGGYVECHHCTSRQQLPSHCPICQKKVTAFGLGVQRVEEELARKFPGIRVQRMDSDSMRTARDYADTLEHFRAGFIDVLVGTQMIAKGLDYPNVRLVGVISADTSLHMPDFRSSERTFQLIAQVAGRTGRGSPGSPGSPGGDVGTVIVQTFSPGDPAIVLASKHDYETFAKQELDVRQQMGLPPVTRMARIVVRDKDHLKCYEQAKALAANLTKFNDKLALNIRIRGPAACALARVAEFHRLQIELIAGDAMTLQKLMAALREARLLKSDGHTAVDVDPVDLL